MTVWRPSGDIRVKVIGLAWRGDRLLVAEVETDEGTVKGVRPLGGTIEHGETREHALQREFLEELDTEIRITGPWHVFENIFEHEGKVGHEIVFAATIELKKASLYDRDRFFFSEDDGTPARTRWIDMSEIALEGLELYPSGLDAVFASVQDVG